MIAINGAGWPRQAKVTHPQHQEYARKTLYAYAPCHGFSGTEYLHEAVRRYYKNNWGLMLRHFVEDVGNQWCPTWIKRNYYMENPPETVADTAVALEKRLQQKWLFQFPEDEEEKPVVKEELPDDVAPGDPAPPVKPSGPLHITSDDEEGDTKKQRWQSTINSGEPQTLSLIHISEPTRPY